MKPYTKPNKFKYKIGSANKYNNIENPFPRRRLGSDYKEGVRNANRSHKKSIRQGFKKEIRASLESYLSW